MWPSPSSHCNECACARNKGFKMNRPRCDDFQDDAKENNQQHYSPMKVDSDVSLYETSSPTRPSCTASSSPRFRQPFRRPFEDQDTNSRDSGYGASFGGERGKFFQSSSGSHSSESGWLCSMDDEYIDFSDLTPLEDENHLPKDFDKLINQVLNDGDAKSLSPRDIRPPLRRAISANYERTTPPGSGARSCLFNIQEDGEVRPFKRSEPPAVPLSPSNVKRSRMFTDDTAVTSRSSPSLSFSGESIKFALQRSLNEPDLIGDFSKTFCLPLIPGRHQDLKSITPTTLAMLMKGCFTDNVSSFKVIDCRYPYEYEGGHIAGAINIYTKEQCLELLNKENVPLSGSDDQRRHILVFHCEFSSERGPNLSRYLRKADRMQNQRSYPTLNYPEVYLLDGGYKSFYEQFSELCEPVSYKPMHHPEHEEDLRHFRAKSKTWNCDTRSSRPSNRQHGSKRLKFP